MCGIIGKVQLNGKAVQKAELTRMRDTLTHRGPDDQGVYLAPRAHVGLGHRRLSIIDTSPAGHQPMSYRDRYWIVFNGEIYNFAALRRELELQGYRFTSHTDTEVILALYDRDKEACLPHLRGMFSLAIYDEQDDVLFCARDRAGQKPFKYYFDGTTFIFASELKAILTQPEYRRAPDYAAIHHYLTYQFVPAPQTGFKNIRKLEPAHYLRLDIRRRKLEKHKYWQLTFANKEALSEPTWQRRLETKLDEATQEQMVADVPLGAFLSGGIDSSAIVALMHRHAAGRLKTFSIGFPEAAHNELSYARLAAQRFGTDHTEFVVTPETIEILPQLVAAFEEPYADSSALPTYYLSKLARAHVTVALNGDGGDENFAGYARYNFHKLALWLDALGVSRVPGTNHLGRFIAAHGRSTFSFRAARFLESLPEQYLRRYVTYLCYFTNAMKEQLYQPSFAAQFLNSNSYDITVNAVPEGAASSFDAALLADIGLYLPDDLLVKVDIASMLSSLEARSPFLDHEFMELAARIPPSLKLRGFAGNKYLLKQTFRGLLPPEIIARPKMGFVVPIEKWFRGDLQAYVKSLLLADDTVITKEMFRREAVRRLLAQHTETGANVAPPLWALLTLELWFRHYFA